MPDDVLAPAAVIRNEPVQARSTARLSALLDAAAAVIDEHGYERLTTAQVADRAGASIGTVYRYFPDRIAVLQTLAARNLDRLSALVRREIDEPAHDSWRSALLGVFDRYLDAFRTEPGFASIRLGDVFDLRPWVGPRGSEQLAAVIAERFSARFGVAVDDDYLDAVRAVIWVMDGSIAHAFEAVEGGDAKQLAVGRRAVTFVLDERLTAHD